MRAVVVVLLFGAGACFPDRTLNKACTDQSPCVIEGDRCIDGVCIRFLPIDIVVAADAGPTDGGTGDSGVDDAGPVDAGPFDAGHDDAGPFDAGLADAGSTDAGPVDPDADDDAGAADANTQ